MTAIGVQGETGDHGPARMTMRLALIAKVVRWMREVERWLRIRLEISPGNVR